MLNLHELPFPRPGRALTQCATVSIRPKTAGINSPIAVQREHIQVTLNTPNKPSTRTRGIRRPLNARAAIKTRPTTTYDYRVSALKQKKPILPTRQIKNVPQQSHPSPVHVETVVDHAVMEYLLKEMVHIQSPVYKRAKTTSQEVTFKGLVDDFVESHKVHEHDTHAPLGMMTLESIAFLRKLLSLHHRVPSSMITRLAVGLLDHLCTLESSFQSGLIAIRDALRRAIYVDSINDLEQKAEEKPFFVEVSELNAKLQILEHEIKTLKSEQKQTSHMDAARQHFEQMPFNESLQAIETLLGEAVETQRSSDDGMTQDMSTRLESLLLRAVQVHLSEPRQSQLIHDILHCIVANGKHHLEAKTFRGMMQQMSMVKRTEMLHHLAYNCLELSPEDERNQFSGTVRMASKKTLDMILDVIWKEHRRVLFQKMSAQDRNKVFALMKDKEKRNVILETLEKSPSLLMGTELPYRLSLLTGEDPVKAVENLLGSGVAPKRRINVLGDAIMNLNASSKAMAYLVSEAINDDRRIVFDETRDNTPAKRKVQRACKLLEDFSQEDLLVCFQAMVLNMQEIILKDVNVLSQMSAKSHGKSQVDPIIQSFTEIFTVLPEARRKALLDKFRHIQLRLADDATNE